jgi:hypothetical protein
MNHPRPGDTARNAVTATLKLNQLSTVNDEQQKLRRMARRLSEFTNLQKYAVPNTPLWRTHDAQGALFADVYRAALNYGEWMVANSARAARSLFSGQPFHLEVLLTFKCFDFRIAGEEDRGELDGRRDGECVGIGDRVLGLQFGRASHSPPCGVLHRDGKSPSHCHAP